MMLIEDDDVIQTSGGHCHVGAEVTFSGYAGAS
jgi:hypothetical protein